MYKCLSLTRSNLRRLYEKYNTFRYLFYYFLNFTPDSQSAPDQSQTKVGSFTHQIRISNSERVLSTIQATFNNYLIYGNGTTLPKTSTSPEQKIQLDSGHKKKRPGESPAALRKLLSLFLIDQSTIGHFSVLHQSVDKNTRHDIRRCIFETVDHTSLDRFVE